MGLSCGMSMVKYILFIFNLLCALCGIALLAIGIVYLVQFKDLDIIVKENPLVLAAPGLIIGLGVVIFLIAFFGCCGAIRESHCMTMTYSVFLLILIILQIIVGALILTKSDDVKDAFNKGFDTLWNKRDESKANQDTINVIQKALECCGRDSVDDYPSNNIPASCCTELSIESVCKRENALKKGCHMQVGEAATHISKVVGYVVLGIAAIELLGFIFACCLATSIRNDERRYA